MKTEVPDSYIEFLTSDRDRLRALNAELLNLLKRVVNCDHMQAAIDTVKVPRPMILEAKVSIAKAEREA